MRLTLDTNFLISATQWKDSVAHKALVKFIEEGNSLFTTQDILLEFSEVLSRDFRLSSEKIEDILELAASFLTIVDPDIGIYAVDKDPDDNKVIECAVFSESDIIVTYDRHLLDLKEYLRIKIITPEEAMKI